jgi:catechol 2,3-dioxygenase-like lactoylglutathione lyase family enzyme
MVRYIVNNIEESVVFYRDNLQFAVEMQADGFAILTKGALKLFVNKPGAGGAGQPMPDGEMPRPGGWNRIQVAVEDLNNIYETLKAKGVTFRNDIVDGAGGKQVLVMDPSGNLVELFEPKRNNK